MSHRKCKIDFSELILNFFITTYRYDLTDSSSGASSDHVLEVFVYEAYRSFRDRLVGTEALNRFDNILATVVRSDWSANVFDSIASKFI